VEFDDIHLERKGNPSWYIEHLPLKNHCMPCAGVIAGTRFEEKSLGIAQGPLLAPREAVIPSLSNRKYPFSHEKKTYKSRHRVENAICRLKDFRRIATRYDRLARNFLAAVCLVAAIVWWTL
jgi:hypothetical protein